VRDCEDSDTWWDRVFELRNREDQRCERCKEWPNDRKRFFKRVTLRDPSGSKTDPANLGIFCYGCKPNRWSAGRVPRRDRRQLHLF